MSDENSCDKCHRVMASESLVWITADDFEPKAGEIVAERLYQQYDALCELCYLALIARR